MKKGPLAFAIAMATLGLAQTPGSEKTLEFEVASVKPSVTQGSFTVNFLPGGGFSTKNVTVHNLLRNAYQLQDYQISGGPSWMDSAGFDIQARAAASTSEPIREQVLKMIQALLADRFHLTLHRESRQLPIYALVVGKNGPKLKVAASDAVPSRTIKMGELVTQKMSLTMLADLLTFEVERPVRDETGLKGDFAFTLEYTRGTLVSVAESDAEPSSRSSLFTAVQEQLGLKLESTKGPVEVMVIDHVEKPSED